MSSPSLLQLVCKVPQSSPPADDYHHTHDDELALPANRIKCHLQLIRCSDIKVRGIWE